MCDANLLPTVGHNSSSIMSAPNLVAVFGGWGLGRGRALLWGESGPDFTSLATIRIMNVG